MGIQWRGGTRYITPVGYVWWVSYEGGSADNSGVLNFAALIREKVAEAVGGPGSGDPVLPGNDWAEHGQSRVLAWNGGPSDVP